MATAVPMTASPARVRRSFAKACYFIFSGGKVESDMALISRLLYDAFGIADPRHWTLVLSGFADMTPDEITLVQSALDRRIETDQGQELLSRLFAAKRAPFLHASFLGPHPAWIEDWGTELTKLRRKVTRLHSQRYAKSVRAMAEKRSKARDVERTSRHAAAPAVGAKPPANGKKAGREIGVAIAPKERHEIPAATPLDTPVETFPPILRIAAEVPRPAEPMSYPNTGAARTREIFLRQFFALSGVSMLFCAESALHLLCMYSGVDEGILKRALEGRAHLDDGACSKLRQQLLERKDAFGALNFTVWLRHAEAA